LVRGGRETRNGTKRLESIPIFNSQAIFTKGGKLEKNTILAIP